MINKIKELQAKFKYLSMRTDLQLKEEAINTTCLDCDTSLEICTCMDDTIDMKEEAIKKALLQMKKIPMTFIPDEKIKTIR